MLLLDALEFSIESLQLLLRRIRCHLFELSQFLFEAIQVRIKTFRGAHRVSSTDGRSGERLKYFSRYFLAKAKRDLER